jgi:hypothetical protein
MKKILLTCAALFAALSLFAQDAPKPDVLSPFKFSGMSYAYGANYKTVTKDQTSSYGSYRFRPYFSYITDNVEATVKLEIDQVFGGSKDNSKFSADGKQQADVGNDEKTVEVKAAYLKFKVPAVTGLTLKGGADEYKTVGGFTCGTELGLGLMNYKTGMADISFVAAKVWEPNTLDNKGEITSEKNDVTFYGIDTTLSVNDNVKIRPALYLIQSEKNQVPGDSKVTFVGKTAMIPSVGANLKFNDLTIDLAAAYGTCAKDKNDVKFSGYAVDIAPTYKMSDSFSITGFFTMLSGDKPDTADKNESFKPFTLKQDGWGRLFLLENMQTFNNAGDHNFADVRGGGLYSHSYGYMVFGGSATYKTAPFEIKGQLGYGRLSQAPTGAKKDLGVECDLQVSYEIEKNAKLIVEGAYLATGKAFGTDGAINTSVEKQTALYAAIGMSYKW